MKPVGQPGARPFVPQRDLLIGDAALRHRHLLARVVLLRRLLKEPKVTQAFDAWTTRYKLRQPLEILTTRLDRLAADAGLPSRADLFASRSTLDPSTEADCQEALRAFWTHADRNASELLWDSCQLGKYLVVELLLSSVCIPWLTWELLSFFFESHTATIQGRPLAWAYSEEPLPERVTIRIDPRRSVRRQFRDLEQQIAAQRAAKKQGGPTNRMPKGTGSHIDSFVGWLVEHCLHGVPVRQLARALRRSEGGVQYGYDGRQRIQYGIRQARISLAAVPASASPDLLGGADQEGHP